MLEGNLFEILESRPFLHPLLHFSQQLAVMSKTLPHLTHDVSSLPITEEKYREKKKKKK